MCTSGDGFTCFHFCLLRILAAVQHVCLFIRPHLIPSIQRLITYNKLSLPYARAPISLSLSLAARANPINRI